MTHPLEKYILIADSNYISRLEEEFYTSYCKELEQGLYVQVEKENNRIKVNGVDLEGNSFSEYLSFSSYFITEYNKLEKETRSNIDNFLFELLDEPKQQLFIKNSVAKLQELQSVIVKLSLASNYEVYKAILLDKVRLFSATLNDLYLAQANPATPKIQWLGKTNVLATLIFELWQGQDKGKGICTTPLIKAQKKDLEALLINNFIDTKGQPLTESTVSDYLNTSKPEKRAKKGARIELDY